MASDHPLLCELVELAHRHRGTDRETQLLELVAAIAAERAENRSRR